MRLLIDAQLPRRLAAYLGDMGHDARHTLDLLNRNRTTDAFGAASFVEIGRNTLIIHE